MATKKVSKRPPAASPEIRENQLVAAAFDLAEQQIKDGTASSQVITHFLKLGSSREYVEKQLLREKAKLASAQNAKIQSEKDREKIYSDALAAMKEYSGND